MSGRSLLVYGANGYTGRLVAEAARAAGMTPILAGRTRAAIELVSSELGLPHRVFDLFDARAVDAGLEGVGAVLHCAGPFSSTSRLMVDGCLRARAHYLDITGEYAVFEAVLGRDEEAKDRGVVLLPGVGFDVVPTDCMARKLVDELPDAARLELAFSSGLLPSPGTAKTTVEGLHLGSVVRQNGKLVTLRAPRTREVPFVRHPRFCMSIPWGDLVTAYRSTGVGDITVYTSVPRPVARLAPLLGLAAPLLRAPRVVAALKRVAERRMSGPTPEQRGTSRMEVWGRVENARGQAVEGLLDVPEGYSLTVSGALESARRALANEVHPGATTPSLAFGADFVTTLPGVGGFELTRTG